MPRFENQRVLVTGSGRGIGSAIALRFAQEGARIQLVARSMDELEQTRSELAPLASEVRAMTLDLILLGSAHQLVDEVARGWGGLDILVTNVGAAAQGRFLELEDDAWAAGFGLKMFANLRVIKRAWPLLKASSGHLVMIGGGTARTPERQLSLVSAVNGGLASLSKSIANKELSTAFTLTWSSQVWCGPHAGRSFLRNGRRRKVSPSTSTSNARSANFG